MRFIHDKDLNKLMSLKPGVARKYRQQNEQKDDMSVPSMPDDPVPPFKQNLGSKSKHKFIPKPIPAQSIKIVRKTTQKPPELQFYSKPLPPPKPIYANKKETKLKMKPKRKKTVKKKKQSIKHVDVSKSLVSQSMQTLNVMDSAVQTMNGISSVEQSIDSMASHKEEEDTVNILSRSQDNLNNFCDNVLSNLFDKNQIDQSPSKCLEILRSIDIQNAEQSHSKHTIAESDIAASIINDIINKAVVCAIFPGHQLVLNILNFRQAPK